MRNTARSFDPRQTMHRPDFEVFHYHDPKMQEVPLHHHDFYELYFFLGGSVEYQVEGRSYALQPEDILLISPRELHRPNIAPGEPYERIVLWINADYLEALSAAEPALLRCFETGQNLLPGARSPLSPLIRQLAAETGAPGPGAELSSKGLFFQCMAELLRLVESKKTLDAAQEETPLIAEVLRYIGEHYREELGLDDLAERFYVSKYHLSHLFRRSVGTSLYRYVLLKRLQHAKQLLAEGCAPGDACRESGFQDYANFYRSFRAVYGLAPQAAARQR